MSVSNSVLVCVYPYESVCVYVCACMNAGGARRIGRVSSIRRGGK